MAPRQSEHWITATGFLADALFAEQRFADAARSYRDFVAARPRDVGAAINFGIALARLGRMNEAVDEFRRAVRLDPRNPTARNNLARAEVELRERGAATSR